MVSTGGAYEYGCWGEIMSQAAVAARLGGLAIDGCVHDHAELGSNVIPVFARGLYFRGTGKDFRTLGSINVPIVVGDLTLRPGDALVGDADGVVVLVDVPETSMRDASALPRTGIVASYANRYGGPQSTEETVNARPSVRRNCSAASAVSNHTRF